MRPGTPASSAAVVFDWSPSTEDVVRKPKPANQRVPRYNADGLCVLRFCQFRGHSSVFVHGGGLSLCILIPVYLLRNHNMFELPLSVVAWISVVLVQAIVHFVVLGARRGGSIGSIVEDPALEECLSLATNDTADDVDSSFTLKDCGYQGTVLPSDPSTPVLLVEKEIIRPEPEQFFELLDQTGTELFKVSYYYISF